MNPRYSQILTTLKNAKPDQIPPFESSMTQMIKEEIKKLTSDIINIKKEILALTQEYQNLLNNKLHHLPQNSQKKDHLNFLKAKQAFILEHYYRIKRFGLIYYNHRLDKIQDHYWNYNGNLLEHNKSNLSEAEKQYFKQYKSLAADYMDAVDIDLTSDLDPPLDPSVEVRFLKDCGQILSDEGEILKLEQNSVFYVKKRLVQNFIKEGSAQVISSSSQ